MGVVRRAEPHRVPRRHHELAAAVVAPGPLCGVLLVGPLCFVSLATPGCGAPCAGGT